MDPDHPETPVILVVNDDGTSRGLLCESLRGHCKVVAAESGEAALGLLGRFTPDLVIVDADRGAELCARIREKLGSSDVAILELSGTEGATRPSSQAELLERIQALLGRSFPVSAPIRPAGILEFGDLALDLRQRVVRRAGKLVRLTPNEFKLLQFLMLRPETTVSRETILRDVWRELDANDRTIDAHICNLRRKLGSRRARIVTVYGQGYALKLAAPA